MNKLILMAALCFGLASQGCIKDKGGENSDDVEYVTVNSQVPSFRVYNELGLPVDFDLASFAGQRTLIVLYDVDCSVCHSFMPVADDIWEDIEDMEGFEMVAIARDGGDGLSQTYRYNDHNRTAYHKFATMWVPRLYVVDNEGKILWMHNVSRNGNPGKAIIQNWLGYTTL